MTGYRQGPAGVFFTPDELLIIWAYLTRLPTAENDEIRQRIRQFLDARERMFASEIEAHT